MQRGKADPLKYPDEAYFREMVLEAEAECEAKWLNVAVKHADNTKDILDLMSRRFPGRWAKKDNMHVELTGKSNGPIILTTEQARQQLASELARVSANLDTKPILEQLPESTDVPEQLGILGKTESDSSEG